jgi:hypothetical protein
MKAAVDFTRSLLALPMPGVPWLGLLVVANLIAPLFFFETIEARVVSGTFLLGGLLMIGIFAALGFVRLLGIGHVLWIPMIAWLLTRLDHTGSGSLFGYWIFAVVALNGVSLIIDAVDVYRYIKGDRDPYVRVA